MQPLSGERPAKPESYTQKYRHPSKAGSQSMFSLGKTHQVVIQCQVVSSENIHVTLCGHKWLYLGTYMCVYIEYTHYFI